MSRRDLDPDIPSVGRQPLLMRWTPSKPLSPWYGTIVGFRQGELAQEGGERFTVEQVHGCRVHGLDPAKVETITAKRQARRDEIYYPASGELPPVFAFDCPVLRREADGRVRVIAPGGKPMLIHPDGWTSRPRTRLKRDYF